MEIAYDIAQHWTNVYFGAKPYLEAMKTLDKPTDKYFQDSADDIIRYFLVNAKTWRGPIARRIKQELRQLLGQ